MLILFFSVQLGWLPSIHKGGDPLSLIMPALTLGLPEAAVMARMVRASLLDVLGQEYIVAARAKGAGHTRVIFKHALRNALIPVVTFLGLQMAYLLGGSAIVETIFARPGIRAAGRLGHLVARLPVAAGRRAGHGLDLRGRQHIDRPDLHAAQPRIRLS